MSASKVETFRRICVAYLHCSLVKPNACLACRRAARLEDSTRAYALNSASEKPFGCERFSLAWNAPGPVEDEEQLVFLLTNPQAVDPTSGKALPDAVTQITKGGLSVLRVGFADVEFVRTYEEMKSASEKQGKSRDLFGVSLLHAHQLRYADGGKRFIGIYATGLPERSRHADLASPKMEKIDEKRMRRRVLELIDKGAIRISDFRNGKFEFLRNSAVNSAVAGR